MPFSQHDTTKHFFTNICRAISRFDGAFLVVAHVLPTLPPFLEALSQIGRVAAIIPKPSSINSTILASVKQHYNVLETNRYQINNSKQLYSTVTSERFILLDVGGYFAKSLSNIVDVYPEQLVGIVEDTENGHQKYAALPCLPVPCISVARSFSKRSEDWLVGQSIVFSAESLLRSGGSIFTAKRVLVIGFGKIGQSIAYTLKSRGLEVMIWDINPGQRIFALSNNFSVIEKCAAIQRADIIFCATGNKSLMAQDFRSVKQGGIIFAATSSDDEFDFDGMENYQKADSYHGMTCFSNHKHMFYLANKGNAVNFLHGAEVRPYIHLVQAAILYGVDMLLKREVSAGKITAITKQHEIIIAEEFERCFYDSSITKFTK